MGALLGRHRHRSPLDRTRNAIEKCREPSRRPDEVCGQTAHMVRLTAPTTRRSRALLPAMTWVEKLTWLAALAAIITAAVLSLVGHDLVVNVANSIVPFALVMASLTRWRARKRAP